jgi:hypothetical protein
MNESRFGEQRAGGGEPNPGERVPPMKESREKIDAFMERLLAAMKKKGRSASLLSVKVFRPLANGGVDIAQVKVTFMNDRFDDFKAKKLTSPEQNVWSVQRLKTTEKGLSEQEWELMADDTLHRYRREASTRVQPPPPKGYRDSFQVQEDEAARRRAEANFLIDNPAELAARIRGVSEDFRKHREGKRTARELGASAANDQDAAELAALLALPEMEEKLKELES